jgi:hypothetical protein
MFQNNLKTGQIILETLVESKKTRCGSDKTTHLNPRKYRNKKRPQKHLYTNKRAFQIFSLKFQVQNFNYFQ